MEVELPLPSHVVQHVASALGVVIVQLEAHVEVELPLPSQVSGSVHSLSMGLPQGEPGSTLE